MSLQRPFRKAVILDRDGTIVVDRHYLRDPAELEFMQSAAEGLRKIYDQGHLLIVVTNQSGIARGLFTQDQLNEVHLRLKKMISNVGAQLSNIYFCPHAETDGCSCRKPSTGLVLQAASDFGFVPSESIVIGNSVCDMELGARIGARTILISASNESNVSCARGDYEACDLSEAAGIIDRLSQKSAGK